MTLSIDARVLAHAASRAKAHPAYLGWVLGRYVEVEDMSEHGLAEFLRASILDLPRLELCLRPRADHFADDIGQISAKFNIDAVALATVVRLVESIETIAAVNTWTDSAESGLLIAARAREKHRKPPGKKKHTDDQSEP